MTTAIASDPYAILNAGSASAASTANDAGSADRFLKLLVTQMQNQDPLNPMDNAEITSQMAQINTVSGLQTLNTTVQGLTGQFVQMQALQGAALVGHAVTVQGNRLAIDPNSGVGAGAYELASPADAVSVEVVNAAGRVVDTINAGASGAGRHDFYWDSSRAGAAESGAEYRFRVVATSGAQAVTANPLMLDQVQAVSSSGSGLVLRTLFSGDVAYADVKAFN